MKKKSRNKNTSVPKSRNSKGSKMNDINFSGQLKQCYDLFNKCYIYFFPISNSKFDRYWKLCCLAPFVIIHNISMSVFVWKIFKEEVNISEVAFMIPVYLVSIQIILTSVIILSKISDVEDLINNLKFLSETSNLTDQQIKKKKRLTKRLNLYVAMFYWSGTISTFLHLTGPLTLVLFRQFILGQHCEFELPYGGVYPYDLSDSWFKYLATYAFQVYTMTCEVCAHIGSEILMIVLCANIAIEFSILREDLLHASPHFKTDNPRNQIGIGLETNSESKTTTSIQDFVRRHQMLIRLAKQLDDIFNKIIFMNLLLVTVTVCFFGLATMVARGAAETMNNLLVMLALLLPVYEFCYYGDLLKEESLGIADSAYINEWYKSDIYYQKMILYVISRSQRPCCLTSLKYVPVTMNLFTKVLSTTWSYFSLVKSIYSRGE
nr:odorant receptor 43 [Papilio xuthus]